MLVVRKSSNMIRKREEQLFLKSSDVEQSEFRTFLLDPER